MKTIIFLCLTACLMLVGCTTEEQAALVSACVIGAVQQARASGPMGGNGNASLSLLNPRNPVNVATDAVVERVLELATKSAHAGANNLFSSPSLFAEYGYSHDFFSNFDDHNVNVGMNYAF